MNRGRALRLLERALLAAGLGCVLLWGGARIHAQGVEARAAREFAEAPAASRVVVACPSSLAECDPAAPAPALLPVPDPDMSAWDPARRTLHARAWTKIDPRAALGRLDIPGLGIAVAVLPGIDALSLNGGVGHVPGTPSPGEPGNVGLAGHRDGFFRGLERIKEGDRLRMATSRGTFEYQVKWIRIVEPREVGVLGDAGGDAITLVTCYPFRIVGSAPLRYIVRADCVGETSAGKGSGGSGHLAESQLR